MNIEELTASTTALKSEQEVDQYKKTYNTFFNEQILQQIGSHDTTKLVGFICASIESGFGLPVSWATKLLDKRKIFDFKIRIDLGHRILNCLILMDETCKVKRPRYMFDLYFKFVKAVKTHKGLQEYETKMIEIMTQGFSRDTSVLHLFLHVPSEDIPWTKYKKESIKILSLVLERIQTGRLLCSADVSSAIWRTLLDLFQAYSESNDPAVIAPTAATIFHYCKKQETEQPSARENVTIYWRLLEIIMQDYLKKCKDKPEVLKPLIRAVGDLCQCGDKKLVKIANILMKSTTGQAQMNKNIEILKKQTKSEAKVTEIKQHVKEADDGNKHVKQNLNTEITEKKNQEAAEGLDTMATINEDKIETEKETDEGKKNQLEEDVPEPLEKVEQLEKKDLETVNRIDEAEEKILSHAPEWSPKLCRLLNPESGNDWRILAQHLGYTSNDICNWVTQSDPCMCLLDEYFATRPTRDATVGVLSAVRTMERSDALPVVTEALEVVDEILRNQPKDFKKPPAILISFHYDIFDKVCLLKKHLKDAGFKSWLNIGQMGGGDKLYDSIDQGIRASKVVICCVNSKYTSSNNNISEVNQIAILGKPVIPLLLEKVSWPPPGSMGPIFGEHLFIRFFTRSGEKTGDQRFWSASKFQELLMQLRYYIAPKKTLVSSDYRGWSKPLQEEVLIKAKYQQIEAKPLKKEKNRKKTEPPSPSIFISYQWGKHREVITLYQRLASLGYHCWLNINHMEGGASLYDQTDKGVRGCKVMLTCVTAKYALSASCRHEIMLADAIEKPIIPVLLEKKAWPPEGPISMAFSNLICSDFTNNTENLWNGPMFDKLLRRIICYISVPDFKVKKEKPKEEQIPLVNHPEANDLEPVNTDHETHTISNMHNPKTFINDEIQTEHCKEPNDNDNEVIKMDSETTSFNEDSKDNEQSKEEISASPVPEYKHVSNEDLIAVASDDMKSNLENSAETTPETAKEDIYQSMMKEIEEEEEEEEEEIKPPDKPQEEQQEEIMSPDVPQEHCEDMNNIRRAADESPTTAEECATADVEYKTSSPVSNVASTELHVAPDNMRNTKVTKHKAARKQKTKKSSACIIS